MTQRWPAIVVLAFGCARAAAPPAALGLASGAHLVSAASQRAAWCGGVQRSDICEDFRDAPVEEVVRFEQQLPTLLRAKGFLHEAELVGGYERSYWGVFRDGRLYLRGSLVCRERLTEHGVVLLVPSCPLIQVTFPAGFPERANFLLD